MSEKNWQFELEEYIKQGEPGKTEKSDHPEVGVIAFFI